MGAWDAQDDAYTSLALPANPPAEQLRNSKHTTRQHLARWVAVPPCSSGSGTGRGHSHHVLRASGVSQAQPGAPPMHSSPESMHTKYSKEYIDFAYLPIKRGDLLW